MDWGKIKKSKWFVPLLGLVVLGITSAVMAQSGWFSTTVPITGTITIQNAPSNFNYTVSSPITVGTNNVFTIGSSVTVTGNVTVSNTGNQQINGFLVVRQNLPSWITSVTITQIPVPVGASVVETVTLSGIAPTTAQTINLVGATALSTGGITITPES